MGSMIELMERAQAQRLVFLDLAAYEPERAALDLVPFQVATRFRAFPLFRLRDRLAVAMAELDLTGQDYLARLTGLTVEPVLVEPEALDKALQRYYVREGQSGRELGSLARQAAEKRQPAREEGPRALEDEAAPVTRLVRHLFSQALTLRASDLHLEVAMGKTRLRYRIDGVLHDFPPPPLEIYPAVVSRVKILADLDIAEKRRPQDGRISLEFDGERLDLRVSIMPQLDGEGVVVRVLRTGERILTLEELGFARDMLRRYQRCATRSHGMILVTGPTGAGKTTTLYATLDYINSPRRKIITLEDPVEYRLEGVCQTPVRADINFSFAGALRAVLRHDPDVMMVGEIRDAETADIAARAALTGHLLLSSLHTNTAPQAITRLLDIGLAPSMITSTLLCVVTQRLVRRLCSACKRAVSLPAETLQALGVDEGATGFAPEGCEECLGLGYKGRLPVYEILEISEAIRALPQGELNSQRVLDLARQEGFVSLVQRAGQALVAGLTSLEEVESFTAESL